MYPLKLYFKRPANSALLIASLVLNFFIWGWLLFYIRPQDDPIFLHYTVLFGVDYTGKWHQVLAVPLGGIVVIVINAALGWFLFEKDAFAGYVLNAASLVVQTILLTTAVLLVFLNV